MIELPRAAISKEIVACKNSLVWNKYLTQTTFGISRDDSGKILTLFGKQNILVDPFVSIDDGVSDLVEIAVEKDENKTKDKLGIC